MEQAAEFNYLASTLLAARASDQRRTTGDAPPTALRNTLDAIAFVVVILATSVFLTAIAIAAPFVLSTTAVLGSARHASLQRKWRPSRRAA